MLVKIDHALRELIKQELGYTVETNTASFNDVLDEEFPLCLFHYEEEISVEEADETIGFYTNDLAMDFEIAVLAGIQDEGDFRVKDYRIECFKELSRFKKFINEARDLFETCFPNSCIIEMQYTGMEVLGFDNVRCAGAIMVSTIVKYRQSRKDPTSPFLTDCC